MTSSLFPKNYKLPERKGGYMKFLDGDNTFRILSEPLMFSEWWEDVESGRRPVRQKLGLPIPNEHILEYKHAWAFVVWNYDANDGAGAIQILEITQRTIQDAIKAYDSNPKWGDPREYDLVVSRQGEGKETKYNTIANPKEALPDPISNAYKEAGVNLDALMDGGDPFAKVGPTTAPQTTTEPPTAKENGEDEAPVNVDDIPF